jgi:hypothetical protein
VLLSCPIKTKTSSGIIYGFDIIEGRPDNLHVDGRPDNLHVEDKSIVSVGLVRNNDNLEIATGKSDNIKLYNSNINIGNRSIIFDNAELHKNNGDLLWVTKEKSINLTKPPEKGYTGELTYIAGSNIRTGDVVCMDPSGNGNIHNAVGGRTYPIKNIDFSGCSKNMTIFSLDSQYCIIAFTKCVFIDGNTNLLATWHVLNKDTMLTTRQFSCLIYKIKHDQLATNKPYQIYSKIIQITYTTYVVVYLLPGDNKIHITDIISIENTTDAESYISINENTTAIELPNTCDIMTADYDSINKMIIFVCYSNDIQNFVVALVKVDIQDTPAVKFILGTICSNLSSLAMADIEKQLHLILIPGGSCLISYGICKLVFIVSNYDGPISPGENFLDYESIDCVDMLYDNNNGIIMTLEKTVSGSCFIQTLDILGLVIQKQSTRGFRNANMEPLGISYNSASDSYAVVYSLGPNKTPLYIQHFDYDGDNIVLGLRYIDSNQYDQYLSVSKNSLYVKHGRCLYEIPGTSSYLYGFEPSHISIFEDGYHGNPSCFLGLSTNNASENTECKVTIKGHIYISNILPTSFVGKKLYLTDANKEFPTSLSISAINGIFIGTCLDANKILLGL